MRAELRKAGVVPQLNYMSRAQKATALNEVYGIYRRDGADAANAHLLSLAPRPSSSPAAGITVPEGGIDRSDVAPAPSVQSCLEELRAAVERKHVVPIPVANLQRWLATALAGDDRSMLHSYHLTYTDAHNTIREVYEINEGTYEHSLFSRLCDILCRMRELAKAPGTYDGNVILPPECFGLMKPWFMTTLLTIFAQAAAAKVLRDVSLAPSGLDARFQLVCNELFNSSQKVVNSQFLHPQECEHSATPSISEDELARLYYVGGTHHDTRHPLLRRCAGAATRSHLT